LAVSSEVIQVFNFLEENYKIKPSIHTKKGIKITYEREINVQEILKNNLFNGKKISIMVFLEL
jgi:deoxyribodipyrimidine photo-lyase